MERQEIINKLAEMKFPHGLVHSVYLPLTLTCHAIGELKNEEIRFPRECKTAAPPPAPKKVVGWGWGGYKRFYDGETHRLQCMYGKDAINERVLYCRQEGEEGTYKIILGFFSFEFDAEQFFQLLQHASQDNWLCFTMRIHTASVRKDEVDKFRRMVNDCPELTSGQRSRAEELIASLH